MPHDKNGVELKAGDRVTVECVVEEVSATPDHCNVKLKTVEPFHPNKDGNTNWFNTKQVVKVGLVLLAVLLLGAAADAGQPGASFSQRTVTRTRGFVPAQQSAPVYVPRQQFVPARQVYAPPVLLAPAAPVYVPQLQFAPADPCLTPGQAAQLRALRQLGY